MSKLANKNSEERVILPGTHRDPLPGANFISSVEPDDQISVTVTLRPRNSQKLPAFLNNLNDRLPRDRQYLTPAELEEIHGASKEDVEKVRTFAERHGLTVIDTSYRKRSMVLKGTAEAMKSAFGVDLGYYKSPRGTYRGRTGLITVPKNLAQIINGVYGSDNRRQFVHHRRLLLDDLAEALPSTIEAAKRRFPGCFTPIDIAKLYGFPDKGENGKKLDGTGQCIGIIECGGGFRMDQLQRYFSELGMSIPKITVIPVGEGHNNPGPDANADGEVFLDIAVAATIAPEAEIAVYFAKIPATGGGSGVIDAILQAVQQSEKDPRYDPSVISISWGAPDDTLYKKLIDDIDLAFQDASGMGKTICIASGDWGVSDNIPALDDRLHVDFPGSNPYALACGGTELQSSNGNIEDETVWNEGRGVSASGQPGPTTWASGGGVSHVIGRPQYQMKTSIPMPPDGNTFKGRGVPDVSGDASTRTGYLMLVTDDNGNEGWAPVGGTSAVAPLWSALIALMNQALPKSVGSLNPLLYEKIGPSNLLRDISAGNNNVDDVQFGHIEGYSATAGWDACTGWGSPNGNNLLNFLLGKP